jgi:hypothetical protein
MLAYGSSDVVVVFIGEGGLSSVVLGDSDGGGVGIHSQNVVRASPIGRM